MGITTQSEQALKNNLINQTAGMGHEHTQVVGLITAIGDKMKLREAKLLKVELFKKYLPQEMFV